MADYLNELLAARSPAASPSQVLSQDKLTPTQAVADWMVEHGYVTGHGDTLDDLLREIVNQSQTATDLSAKRAASPEGSK